MKKNKKTTMGLGLLMGLIPGIVSASDSIPHAIQTDKAAESLLVDITLAGERLIAVGERGHIVLSDDRGGTWKQAKVPTQLLLTGVAFANEQTGWAIGHNGIILKTEDAGMTWTIQHHAPMPNTDDEAELANDEDQGDALGADDNVDNADLDLSGAFGGGDFMDDGVERRGSPLLDLWVASETEVYVVGAYGYFLHTGDGGKEWQDYSDRVDNYDGWHLNTINKVADHWYIGGEQGTLFRSKDGQAWDVLEGPYLGSYFYVGGGLADNEVVLTGLQGRLFNSTDAGETWQSLQNGAGTAFNYLSRTRDGALLAVGNQGLLLRKASETAAGDVFERENRLSLLAFAELDTGQVVAVGEGGVQCLMPRDASKVAWVSCDKPKHEQ